MLVMSRLVGRLAGGGLRTGQMIGNLDRHGIHNTTRPVHNHEVLATIYHNLGIDVSQVKITDPAGRPLRPAEVGRSTRPAAPFGRGLKFCQGANHE